MRFLFILLVFGTITPGVYCFGTPPDSTLVLEKMVLQSDYLREKNYSEAEPPTEWLLQHVPGRNISIYINAEKVYKGLLAANPNDTILHTKLLKALDTRVKYFGRQEDVLKRKAYWAYKFWKATPSHYSKLNSLLSGAFELNKGNVPENLFIAKMDLYRRMRKVSMVSDSVVLAGFNQIIGYFDKYHPQKEETRDLLYKLLTQSVDLDCDQLEQHLFKELVLNPTDTGTAKLVVRLGLSAKCSGDDFFLKAVEMLVALEPTYGLQKYLATLYGSRYQYNNALKCYDQALDISDSDEEKYEVLMSKARIHQKTGDNISARMCARKAISYSTQPEPYELIGDLYLASTAECKKGISRVEDRSIYWAACDQYKLAGNAEKMEIAQQQFPTIAEIFDELYKEGTEYEVGCWIKEKTIVRRR